MEEDDGDEESVESYLEEELLGFDFSEEDLLEFVLIDSIIQNQKIKMLEALNVDLLGRVDHDQHANADVLSHAGSVSNSGIKPIL
jgi:hypothetical protein